MVTEDEIILSALEREHARLSKIADQAKSKCDACLFAGSTLMKIHNEMIVILNGNINVAGQAKLKELEKSAAKVKKLMKQSIVTLSDKECDAEWNRDLTARALERHRWTMELRKGK